MTRGDGQSATPGAEIRFSDPPKTVRDGVQSWTDVRAPPEGVDADVLMTVLRYMRSETTRDAVRLAVEDHGMEGTRDERDLRNALFVDPADAWRIPVSDAIGGRCLDVNAGVGTRALLLAELATTVDAVDDSVRSLAFLDRRDDYAVSDRVTAIHADPLSPPRPEDRYDTIVADFTGRDRPQSLRSAVSGLEEFLKPSGSLLLLVDGWPRRTGLTSALGIGTSPTTGKSGSWVSEGVRGGKSGYERLLAGEGYTVEQYGVVPDPEDPSYLVPVGDSAAARRLVNVGRGGNSAVERLAARAAGLMLGTGLLDYSWPASLLVRRPTGDDAREPWGLPDGGSSGPQPSTDGLLTRGGGRSTVLVTDSGGAIRSVTKVPHRRAHAEFALDERRTMETIRSEADPDGDPAGLSLGLDSPSVPETIPDGTVTMTRFGPTYREAAVEGTPLSTFVSEDPDRFRAVLESGFDWLARLHQLFGGQPARWSREVVRNDLSCPAAGLEPPSDANPVRLFRVPCHGDFHPKNVFVDADGGGSNGVGPITAVIDWELGARRDNPVADAGFFALQTARLAFGGLESGIDAAFATPGPHADVIRDVVGQYCASVGITLDAFLTYLPYAWVRRLRRCESRGATASYSGRAVRRANDVRLVRDRRSDIAAVLAQ